MRSKEQILERLLTEHFFFDDFSKSLKWNYIEETSINGVDIELSEEIKHYYPDLFKTLNRK